MQGRKHGGEAAVEEGHVMASCEHDGLALLTRLGQPTLVDAERPARRAPNLPGELDDARDLNVAQAVLLCEADGVRTAVAGVNRHGVKRQGVEERTCEADGVLTAIAGLAGATRGEAFDEGRQLRGPHG